MLLSIGAVKDDDCKELLHRHDESRLSSRPSCIELSYDSQRLQRLSESGPGKFLNATSFKKNSIFYTFRGKIAL